MKIHHPITVQTWYRPRRLAFFVPPNVSIDTLSIIFRYNQEIWDGRYNPIIVTDGVTIQNYFWAILKFCCPDVIFSFVPIEQSLIKKINKEISPRKIRIIEKEYPDFGKHSEDCNLSCSFRVNELLQKRNFIKSNAKFLKIHSPEEFEYYHFILFNFGITSSPFSSYGVTNLPVENTIEIDFRKSNMPTFLNSITKYIDECILPIEFCESKLSIPIPEFSQEELAVVIFVGDSANNLIYCWNRIFFNSPLNRKTFGQIWIPTKVTDNPELQQYMIKLIEYLRYMQWSEHKLLRLFTFDLTLEKLNLLKKFFSDKNIYFQEVKVMVWEEAPIIETRYKGERMYGDLGTLQQVIPSPSKLFSSSTAIVAMPKPNFILSDLIQGCWMVDNRIELHPEKYTYTNTQYWLQLPKRVGIGNTFINKSSRINRYGEVSIQVNAKDNVITLSQPSEYSIFWSLLRNENNLNVEDRGNKRAENNNSIDRIDVSDKGKYLHGVISLFGGLFQTYCFLNEHYWRECFEYMARSPKEFNNERKEKISKIIETHLPDKNLSQSDLDYISRKISSALLATADSDKVVTIDFFYDKIKKRNEKLLKISERQKLKVIENLGITSEQKKEIEQDVQDLTEKGILLVGIRPKCPHCGSYLWYGIENVKKNIICSGCQKDYPYPIESKHFYKLNSLLVNGISKHGIIWQCLYLYEILHRSRNCFLYYPNVWLFRKDDIDPFAELDLVCISDGTFIIGEIKSSADSISQKHFFQMVELSKEIEPERIIFGVGEPKFKNFHYEQIKSLEQTLSAFDTHIELMTLSEDCFEQKTYPYIG